MSNILYSWSIQRVLMTVSAESRRGQLMYTPRVMSHLRRLMRETWTRDGHLPSMTSRQQTAPPVIGSHIKQKCICHRQPGGGFVLSWKKRQDRYLQSGAAGVAVVRDTRLVETHSRRESQIPLQHPHPSHHPAEQQDRLRLGRF